MNEDNEKPLNKCNYCDKVYNKKKHLTQHTKRAHHKILVGEGILEPQFTCVFCNKSYGYKSLLQRHIDTVHIVSNDVFLCDKCAFTTKSESYLKKHMIKMHFTKKKISKEKIPKKLICSYCSTSFSYKGNLRRHEKKVHGISNYVCLKKIHRKCPLCSFTSNSLTKNEINIHFSEVHGLTLRQEEHSFDSMDNFSKWKDDLEKHSMTFYVKQQSHPNTTYYVCHRRGYFKRSGTNRHLKIGGSCKINGHCPSEMKVKISDTGIVSVFYVPTHVGHTNKLRFKRLNSLGKQLFVLQLLKKTPQEEKQNLLKRLKNTRTSCIPSKKGIANKEKSIHLDVDIQQFDPVCVETWVQELRSLKDTALLVYKPQGRIDEKLPELKEEDFLLIFMTEEQKALLKFCGNDTICIDTTNTNTIGLNNYNFQLYTLHTIDECREGFPCAFMFTNKGDKSTLSLFFRGIKEITGTIQTNIFMSNIEETVYSAWTSTMGPSNLRLFCTWHVLNEWRNNLHKIKIKEKRAEVYKVLKTLLYELDVDKFNKMISTVVEKLYKDHDSKEYSEYFSTMFIKNEKYRHWAYCYRTYAGINTNISLDNFNQILKHCYLKGTNEQSLDKTVCAILELLRVKLYNDLISGKLVLRKFQDLRKRHKRALTIPSENVVQDGEKWNVSSSKGSETYAVKKVQECKNCRLQCSHCNSCFHEFICTCRDNSIKHNMCEHIHAVARSLPDEHNLIAEPTQSDQIFIYIDQNYEEEPILQEVIITEIDTDCSKKTKSKLNETNFEEEPILQEVIVTETNPECSNKTKIELKEICESFLKKITTNEQVEFVRKRLKEILTAVDTMDPTVF